MVFAHVALHSPRPGHDGDVLASMGRVRAAADGAPGLIRMEALRVEEDGRLLALAIWESREAWEAAAPGIFAVVADDPFDEWEVGDPAVLHASSDVAGTLLP